MRSFQAVLAILMAAMVNMVLGAPGIAATAVILAATFVDTVTSSGFQHSVVATPRIARSVNSDLDICFDNSTTEILHEAGYNSPLVPWIALQRGNNDTYTPQLYDMFEGICMEISATILSRNVSYTSCRPDMNPGNSTYSVMAQVTYRGPHSTYDMRKHHNTCMTLMFFTLECPYGGLFRDVGIAYANTTHRWTVQARPVEAACPDCSAGLLNPFADQN
ncbi:hypothetical protein Daus18300_013358 [Diaporthe australafricana]|uniref:Uncharacterized protein n=1 Tax=Diaporthe australafricana TaxID=127596 RepID=A0ABR3VZB9_9PEZI